MRLVWAGFHAGLGVNPVEFVEHETGDWALNFFCLTLAVTPLARTTGWSWWMRRRRMLGLFVSFYAGLHFLTYLILDNEVNLAAFIRDVQKRPYILVGFLALVLLVPLTLTSTDAMIRRLKRWWGRIHALIYAAALLGVVHYLWLVKADKSRPLQYAAVLSLLLGYRVVMAFKSRWGDAAPTAAALALALIAAAPTARAGPVIVELFTSQGCSSCPDADAVVSRWGTAEFMKGKVLPLTYNVDYWNYLGWKDVFSAPVYSRRQRGYASALGVGVYTPQMVVAGRSAFVGSDGAKARQEAARFGGEAPRALISIAASESPRVKLQVTVKPLRKPEGNLRVVIAFFENELLTEVLSGENAGSSLRADFVVRRMADLGTLPADGQEFHRVVEDPWDPGWNKARSGAAVFLQDADTLAIFDAASLYPLQR